MWHQSKQLTFLDQKGGGELGNWTPGVHDLVHDESGEILVIHFIHPETKGLFSDQKDTRESVWKKMTKLATHETNTPEMYKETIRYTCKMTAYVRLGYIFCL